MSGQRVSHYVAWIVLLALLAGCGEDSPDPGKKESPGPAKNSEREAKKKAVQAARDRLEDRAAVELTEAAQVAREPKATLEDLQDSDMLAEQGGTKTGRTERAAEVVLVALAATGQHPLVVLEAVVETTPQHLGQP